MIGGEIRRNALRRLIPAFCAALLITGVALAQTFPTRSIHLIVGYSPGGGNDLIARIVAAKLQEKLGQPVIVDNRPGAQSIVAAEAVAKAPSDGYTLLVAPSGPMTINPAVYAKLSYSPQRDFAPISLLAEFPLLLAVGAEQPPKTARELVEYGRANPKLANYASSATPFQLASELFNQRTGSKFQHIPYKGSGEIVQAVTSGQVMMAFADAAPTACYEIYAAWKEGDAELARLKQERITKATLRVSGELGIPGLKYGMDLNGYYGGPARLPLLPLTADLKAEVERLLGDIRN